MPSIDTSYHAHSGNYTSGGNSCDYIVIHNTGNTASANAEARYAQNDQHSSSYHYVLDSYNIYQVLPDTDTAWAVGAWSGATQLIRNNQSISIEVCSNGVEFTSGEITNLTWLVGTLMERHGIDASHVVRHYDCHTGHKECPAAYVSAPAWSALHATITEGADMATPQEIWEWHYDGQDAPFYQLYYLIKDQNAALLAQVAGLTEAVKAISTATGADPEAIFDAAQKGAAQALANSKITVDVSAK